MRDWMDTLNMAVFCNYVPVSNYVPWIRNAAIVEPVAVVAHPAPAPPIVEAAEEPKRELPPALEVDVMDASVWSYEREQHRILNEHFKGTQ